MRTQSIRSIGKVPSTGLAESAGMIGRKSNEAKGLDERSSLIERHNIATINETINDTTDLEASRHYGTESNTIETDHFPIELERFVNSKTNPVFVR